MKGETRRRRGFIAQQAEKADDLYTFLGIEQEIDGEKFKVMNVDYTAIMLTWLRWRRVYWLKIRNWKGVYLYWRGSDCPTISR
ncbi:hypothetical protein [Klebsiella pneumoniae IS39]|nr:hypothetical protein [Klebsiella pneumoniae IS39]